MADGVKVLGLRELEQNLNMLGSQVRERGVRLMLTRGAAPMRDEAQRLAPVLKAPDPRRLAGTVRDAIKIWRKRQTPYAATYYVGVRGLSASKVRQFKQESGKAGNENPADPFYWRWVELGTSRMRAMPFLRPAFEAKKMESVRAAAKAGAAFIERALRRAKRVRR